MLLLADGKSARCCKLEFYVGKIVFELIGANYGIDSMAIDIQMLDMECVCRIAWWPRREEETDLAKKMLNTYVQ